MYVFPFPMNTDHLIYSLSQYAKRMSMDSLTKSNCCVYWQWKCFIKIWFNYSGIRGYRFHGFIRKHKDSISIVGLFGISPVLFFLVFILLPLLLMLLSFDDYSLMIPGSIIGLTTALLTYLVYEAIINYLSYPSKERVIDLFQRLSTQEIEKSETQLDSAHSVEQKINH